MSEWIETKNRLPSKSDCTNEDQDVIWCYIYVNGDVCERPYNLHHNCWDNYECDDFEFDATYPTHWMLSPPLPDAPNV